MTMSETQYWIERVGRVIYPGCLKNQTKFYYFRIIKIEQTLNEGSSFEIKIKNFTLCFLCIAHRRSGERAPKRLRERFSSLGRVMLRCRPLHSTKCRQVLEYLPNNPSFLKNCPVLLP